MKYRTMSNKFLEVPLSLLLCVIISCGNEGHTNMAVSEIEKISVNESNSQLLYSDVFSKVEYIKLETVEGSLFYPPIDLKIRNNRFYFLDTKTKGVFVFSKNGDFISKICPLGNGPGEYTLSSDFDVDSQGNVYINTMNKRLLMKYDFLGNYIDEYPSVNAASICLLGENAIMYGHNYNLTSNSGSVFKHQLVNLDLKKGKLSDIVSFNPDISYVKYGTYRALEPIDENEVLFLPNLSQDVFLIRNSNDVTIKYQIIFKKKIPESLLKEAEGDQNYLLYNLKKNTYAYKIDRLLNSNDHLYFIYMYNDTWGHVFYHKVSKAVQSSLKNGFTADMDFVPFITLVGKFDTGMIASIDAIDFIKGAKAILSSNYFDLNSPKRAHLKNLLESTTPGDNPIIALYYF